MSVFQDQNDYTSIQGNFFRNKAVSDGAISFYLDHFVRTRVSKVTYGVFVSTGYDPSVPDHRSRSHNVYTCNSGVERIGDFFDIVLPKVSFLIPFLKSMLLKKLLYVEYPNSGDEGIQRILWVHIRFCSSFPSSLSFYLVLPWEHHDSEMERR